MQSILTQQNRLLALNTPAGEDALILTDVIGIDGVSRNFAFTLTALSQDTKLNAADPAKNWRTLVGERVSFSITEDEASAVFNGIVYGVKQWDKAYDSGICRYELTVVPWFECLRNAQDCQVFHNQSVIEIFTQVCQAQNFNDFDISAVQNAYPKLKRCVQFNETTVHFLQRLLAEAGIYYYYVHSDEKHTLILCDQQNRLPNLNSPIGFRDSQVSATISRWRPHNALTPNQVATNAYEFSTPDSSLLSTVNPPGAASDAGTLTAYHYRTFANLSEGSALARRLCAIDAWQANTVTGESNVLSFTAGSGFTFAGSPCFGGEASDRFLLLSIRHEAHDHSHLVGQVKPDAPVRGYKNRFTALSSSYTYYPAVPAAPQQAGYHHGLVTTANHQETDTDTYGEIKVALLWERSPATADKFVQYARVTQPYAGKDHGMQFIPRNGQEVVLGHINGDLCKPAVVGALYNDNDQPLFPLPALQFMSGFKTHSVNAENPSFGNMLLWSDQPGQELMALHSQKDLNIAVLNNYVHTINGGEDIHVSGDITTVLQNGSASITAKAIHFIVGGTSLVLDAGGISAKVAGGGQVQLLAKGAGAMLPVARLGDLHKCPKKSGDQPHQGGPVLQGAASVMANGLPIARVNDPAHCKSGTDTISTGVNSILINGQPVARLNDQTAHGGVIVAASPNVLAGETPGVAPTLPPPPPLLSAAAVPPGPHWIQAKYTHSDGTPMSAMPYTTKHSDGTTVTGTLNGSGETQKVQGLNPGTSTIQFGNIDALNAQLAQQRATLQNSLNAILAAAKAQAAQDQQQIAKQSWWDKVYTYGKGFTVGAVDGAIDATEAGGKMIAALFEDSGDILALSARIEYDEATGNSADLNQVSAEAKAKAQSIIKRIENAYDTLQAVYEDPDTRAILEDFAENYYHTMSGLMMLKDVGSFTGGIIPGIVIAIITKNPEALGAGMAESAGPDIAAAGNEVAKIAETQMKKAQCAEVMGADVDKEHEVKKPVPKKVIFSRKKIAYNFYKKAGYNNEDIRRHLKGIDFNNPVIIKKINQGELLQQWQVSGNWQGNYYSELGETPTRLGINPQGQPYGTETVFAKTAKFYQANSDIEVLQSTANDIVDDWSVKGLPFKTAGGATQYFTPEKGIFVEVNNE